MTVSKFFFFESDCAATKKIFPKENAYKKLVSILCRKGTQSFGNVMCSL